MLEGALPFLPIDVFRTVSNVYYQHSSARFWWSRCSTARSSREPASSNRATGLPHSSSWASQHHFYSPSAAQGRISVKINDEVKKELLPGDKLGELALLYDAPRSASCEAKETSFLWGIDRKTFKWIVQAMITKQS